MGHVKILLLTAVALVGFGVSIRAQELKLGGSVVIFATPEQGKAILTNRDAFVSALSPFDRAFRMQSETPVSESEYLGFVGKFARTWTVSESNQVAQAWGEIARRPESLHLPLPREVLLVKTSGEEEFSLFYTRQNAIIFPQSEIRAVSPRLLAHELFHVISRENPKLRERLYGIIGFHRINEIELPREWQDRRCANPDGFEAGWRIAVTNSDQGISAVPVLMSPSDFHPNAAQNPIEFFSLLVVTNTNGRWAPVLNGAQPRLLKVAQVSGFYEQVGYNTGYVIHPDEILADNFADLMLGRTNVHTPRIQREMKAALEESSPRN